MFRTEYIDILWYFWLVRYLGLGPSYHRSKHQLEASEGSFRSLDPRKCPTALSGLYKEEDEDHAHPCGKGEGKLFDSSILWPGHMIFRHPNHWVVPVKSLLRLWKPSTTPDCGTEGGEGPKLRAKWLRKSSKTHVVPLSYTACSRNKKLTS